jgi:[histone H3]-lysine36 N-dimethyltransferase SETMAR
VNFRRRKSWVPKSGGQAMRNIKEDLHPRKKMLCVWWNIEGVIHWELLPQNETINAETYCDQLRRVCQAANQKYPKRKHSIILQHDNARPHVAKMTKTVIQELGWEVLPHPPYSPDLAPSDYYLFLLLSNTLKGVTFDDDQDMEKWLGDWFKSKDDAFYRKGIEKMPEKWEAVVNNDGDYFI